MKKNLLIAIVCTFNLFISELVYAQDTDGDTINDVTDIDDDNDGIIDTNEMGSCASAIYNGYSATVYDGVNGQDSWGIVSGSTTFPVAGFTQIATFDYDEFENTIAGLSLEFTEHPYNLSTSGDGDVSNHSGTTIPNNGDSDAAIVFSRTIKNTEAGIYDFQLDYADDHLFIYLNGVKQFQQANVWATYGNDGVYATTIASLTLNTGDVLEIVVVEENTTNTHIDSRLVKTANIGGGAPTCPIDTDGDGIANHLDVDSDNDGCYDALEGANNILVGAVDGNGRLTGAVNMTTGVPNNVNTTSGQGTGTATNASTFDSFNQCDRDNDGVLDGSDVCPNADDTADNDTDGVPDGCDDDDDNDGILDINELGDCTNAIFEGYSASVYNGTSGQNSWALVSSASSFPVTGFTQIATFDYDEFENTPLGFSIDIFEHPYNIATTAQGSNYSGGSIPNDGSSDAAYSFSRVIKDVEEGIYDFEIDYGDDHIFLYINGVKQFQLQNAYASHTQDGVYTTVTTGLILNVGDTVQLVVVEDLATNTELDVRLIKTANIGGGTSTCPMDTDFDGIANHLDIDSDNDSCKDVLESGGTDSDGDGELDGNGYNASGQVTTGGVIIDGYDGINGNEIIATEIDYTPPVDIVAIEGNNAIFSAEGVILLTTQGYTGSSPNYVDVTASSSTAGFSYQWYIGDPNLGGILIDGTDTNYTGYTTRSLNIVDVTGLNGTQYCLVVSNTGYVCDKTSCATLYLIVDPCDPVLSGNPDYDNDGVSDYCDKDDDNDAILDSAELRCDQPTVANSTSGTGVYQDQFYIFNWTDPSFADGLHNGDSQTFTVDGITIVATVSGISIVDSVNASMYTPSDIDTYPGALIKNLYDTSGTSEAFIGSNDTDMSFTMTFTATKCGNPYRLDILAIDAESTSITNEYIRFTTNGAVWNVAETIGGGGDWIGVGTKSIEAVNTQSSGGNTIFYSENASSITAELNGSGIQAAAFGLWLICDTDADCIPDFQDLDSDGDSCPDVYEGAGSFTEADFVEYFTLSGGNTNIFDSLIVGADADNDGILDIAEPSGQGVGSSQDASTNNCPVAIDFDGVNDLVRAPNTFNINSWSELTLQFWVKAEDASQTNAGIIGQKGVLEITQNGNLDVHLFGQGAEGIFSGAWLNDATTWKHITLVYDNGDIKVYQNGKNVYDQTSSGGTSLGTSVENFNIGGDIKTGASSNNFNGWIDEVRVFNVALTESQVQQTVHQEIEDNGGDVRGVTIPKNITDTATATTLSWNSLELYYKMGTSFIDRNTIDYSGNGRHASIHNIYSQQTETAPMPFITQADGTWNNNATWLHGDVWDVPSDASYLEPSGIFQINHDVTLNDNLQHTGMLVDAAATLTIGASYGLNNNWYLELNGTIDLLGDSQLIQTINSDLVTSAAGNVLRRQEGEANVYRYNYWSSPVGALSASSLTNNNIAGGNPNNTPFTLNMLKDSSGGLVPFTTAYDLSGSISSYWLYTFQNGVTYYDWVQFNDSDSVLPGVGYSQKGGGSLSDYIFDGKPNNGTIVLNGIDTGGSGSVANISKTEYLVGNPYPSAIDAHQFIDDNGSTIFGTIYLWEHWSGSSHILNEYQGGYATRNKTAGVPAYQFVGLSDANNGSQDGTKTPGQYIPPGQGFMVEVIADGDIVFNNGQRTFITEGASSVFLKTNNLKKGSSKNTTSKNNIDFKKIRLQFKTDTNLGREIVMAFSNQTSDAFDYGYDAKAIETFVNDFTMTLDDEAMVIQAYGEIEKDKIVDINFKSDGTSVYSISATEFTNFTENQDVYLLDNLTETYYDLKSDTPYSFSSAEGVFEERFDIVFENKASLSIVDNQIINKLNVYNKSNKNRLTILNPDNQDIETIKIYNTLGQSVYSNHELFSDTKKIVNLLDLSSGVYIVKLTLNGKKVYSKKIIIN